MPDVKLSAAVPLPPDAAFDVYVGQMNTWWPRQGVFPYSFAPDSTFPRHIRFEARLGGRYYETFADAGDYVIGHITRYEPPHDLAYTWRDPSWQTSTRISLRFVAAGDGAEVHYEQDGFAEAGAAGLAAYYQIGCEQTLAGYIAHCRALHQLQRSGLSWG